MNRGEIYKTQEKAPERGHKPGFYVVVCRSFIADNEDIETVICAPVYREILGIRSEVIIGPDEGLPHESSIRCDFLRLMFKKKLTHFGGDTAEDEAGGIEPGSAVCIGIDDATASIRKPRR